MNDPPSSAATLPVTNPIITAVAKQREEPVVKAAGPFFAVLGFLIFPLIWCVPEALVTAELSTSLPGNGGYIIWTHKAFGPFWGSLMGSWKFITSVINLAAFPILCVNYIEKLFPIFSSGLPRVLAILISHVVLAFINFTGLNIVGFAAIAVGVVSLLPFGIMSPMAIPHIKPHRCTMAGEVKKPKKTFPRVLLCAVLMTCICYIVPLLATTGAIELDQTQWDLGYMAVAAETIGGKWLKIFLNIGSVLSSIGLYLALLSSCAFQILGMAEHGCLPKFFEESKKIPHC
nr:probable polyamine transporter At3g13620 [Tanacetum cinerariifolium]